MIRPDEEMKQKLVLEKNILSVQLLEKINRKIKAKRLQKNINALIKKNNQMQPIFKISDKCDVLILIEEQQSLNSRENLREEVIRYYINQLEENQEQKDEREELESNLIVVPVPMDQTSSIVAAQRIIYSQMEQIELCFGKLTPDEIDVLKAVPKLNDLYQYYKGHKIHKPDEENYLWNKDKPKSIDIRSLAIEPISENIHQLVNLLNEFLKLTDDLEHHPEFISMERLIDKELGIKGPLKPTPFG